MLAGGATRPRRRLGWVALVLAPLVLSGCTVSSFGAHPSVTTTGRQTYHLWQGFTIGAIVVGGFTLALIVWAAVRYRAHPNDDRMPRQTQYHLPLEVVYTVIPILIVLVLFAFTVVVENNVTALPAPAVTINVDAFQWGWRFTYPEGANGPHPGLPMFTIVGQTTQKPTMEMPEGVQVQIVLRSLDVIHGFYVPEFNFSRQAIPGITNKFTFDAQQTGTFFGQCTNICGLYHSIMWFQVKVVSQGAYATWVAQQTTAAARLAAIASGVSTAQQLNPGVSTRPDVGGGTNYDRAHRAPGRERRRDRRGPRPRGGPRRARAPRAVRHPQVADLDRPQGHRPQLHDHVARDVPHRGDPRRAHPHPAHHAQQQLRLARAVQPALHDARQPDDLPVRRPVRVRRAREHHRPAADRRAGHGVPAAERAQLLALPVRLAHDAPRLLRRRRRRRTSAGPATHRSRTRSTAPARGRTCGSPHSCSPGSRRSSRA